MVVSSVTSHPVSQQSTGLAKQSCAIIRFCGRAICIAVIVASCDKLVCNIHIVVAAV